MYRKTLITTFSLLLLVVSAFAQDTLATYKNQYAPSAQTIRLADVKGNAATAAKYQVIIDINPALATPKNPYLGSITIEKADLPQFLRCLSVARAKMIQWNRVAESQNIKEAYREMHDCFDATDSFVYNISGERKEVLLYTGDYPLLPNPKKVRKESGLTLSFGSPEEITVFIKLLNPVTIAKTLNAKRSAEKHRVTKMRSALKSPTS